MRGVWKQMAICLLLTPWLSHGQSADPATKTGVVCWQEGRKLQWVDFTAPNEPSSLEVDPSLEGTVMASTEANAIIYDGTWMGTVVSVQFDKRKSWINKRYFYDRKATLIHEQLHFDVVELTGRKIRQVLAQCRKQGLDYHNPTTTADITCLYEDEADLQSLIDKKTKAGNDLKAQAYWQAFVKRELARLYTYRSTAQDCIMP